MASLSEIIDVHSHPILPLSRHVAIAIENAVMSETSETEGHYPLGSFGSHGRHSYCPRTPRWNLRAPVEDAMQLSMKDKSYMLKKGGHVQHHLKVAGVISLLSVLWWSGRLLAWLFRQPWTTK